MARVAIDGINAEKDAILRFWCFCGDFAKDPAEYLKLIVLVDSIKINLNKIKVI